MCVFWGKGAGVFSLSPCFSLFSVALVHVVVATAANLLQGSSSRPQDVL